MQALQLSLRHIKQIINGKQERLFFPIDNPPTSVKRGDELFLFSGERGAIVTVTEFVCLLVNKISEEDLRSAGFTSLDSFKNWLYKTTGSRNWRQIRMIKFRNKLLAAAKFKCLRS